MSLIFPYKSKKELKENIGKRLLYIETSIFNMEYRSDGVIYGANRPHITGIGREWFAAITMEDNLIKSVE